MNILLSLDNRTSSMQFLLVFQYYLRNLNNLYYKVQSKESQQSPLLLIYKLHSLQSMYHTSRCSCKLSKSSFHPTAKRNKNAIYLEFFRIFRVSLLLEIIADRMLLVSVFIRQTNFVQLFGSLFGWLWRKEFNKRSRFLRFSRKSLKLCYPAPPFTFTLFQLSDFIVWNYGIRWVFVEIGNVKIITELLIGICD